MSRQSAKLYHLCSTRISVCITYQYFGCETVQNAPFTKYIYIIVPAWAVDLTWSTWSRLPWQHEVQPQLPYQKPFRKIKLMQTIYNITTLYNQFTSNEPTSMASMLLNNLRAWHVAALSQTSVPSAHSRKLALPLHYPLGISRMSIQPVLKVDALQACASTLWEPASKLSTVHPSK